MSSTSDFSVNVVREIWNDKNGCRTIVGPDGDGLDLVQIHDVNSDGVRGRELIFTPAEALLVANAMIACAEELAFSRATHKNDPK